MKTALLLAAFALATLSIPLVSADLDDADITHVCVQSNKDCYYTPYANCLSGYDSDNSGNPVGYLCSRPPTGECLFQYPDGDGTTCVVLLMSDQHHPAGFCAVSYSPWEYSGYSQYGCIDP